MKRIGVYLFVLIFLISLVIGQSSLNFPSGKDVNKFAEILGENILKTQNFLLGSLEFISLGVFDSGKDIAFAQFLLMTLAFMIIYTLLSQFFKISPFIISLVLTAISFTMIDPEVIQMFLLTYEAFGVVVTVLLPIFILLAFTFRIYQRAYEGKSDRSPFYAGLFNAFFLVFFGVFFIRHSTSEEEVIAFMRFVSGWVLIVYGVVQFKAYRVIANILHRGAKASLKEQKEEKSIKRKILEEAKKKEDEIKYGLKLD